MPCRRPALLLVLLAAGCSDRPKAPPLTNDAVYQNEKIGLRFLTPEGWLVSLRSELPPGPLTRPGGLVAYQTPRGERPGEMQLLAAELGADGDFAAFVIGPRVSPDKWTPKPPPTTVTV